MPDSLKGKRIILAGGTGGLGSAATGALAAEGAELIVSYHSNTERAANLESAAHVIQADLRSASGRRRLLSAAPDLYGLVVFAGIPARVSDPDEMEAAMVASHESNYLGPILLARDAATQMHTTGVPGAIVLISTMQAVALFPGSTAYGAPKAALAHAARILAKECRGPSNIRVNVVCPGVNDAGMAQASVASGKYKPFIESGIIPRYGRPEDIARAVRFFLEPDNYITGQVLTVDGGLTL